MTSSLVARAPSIRRRAYVSAMECQNSQNKTSVKDIHVRGFVLKHPLTAQKAIQNARIGKIPEALTLKESVFDFRTT